MFGEYVVWWPGKDDSDTGESKSYPTISSKEACDYLNQAASEDGMTYTLRVGPNALTGTFGATIFNNGYFGDDVMCASGAGDTEEEALADALDSFAKRRHVEAQRWTHTARPEGEDGNGR